MNLTRMPCYYRCDFQDNPKYLPELIKEWESGNDIVLAKRIGRKRINFRKLLINLYFKIQKTQKFYTKNVAGLFFVG